MTVYKIDENCKGDCEYLSSLGVIELHVENCHKKDKIRFGNVELPCNFIYYIYPERDFIFMHKGERFRLLKDVYIEFEGSQRVYLDYEKYRLIYNYAKLIKKIKITGFVFTFDEDYEEVRGFPYHYFTPEYIRFLGGTGMWFQVFTENGIMRFYSDSERNIRKGECRKVNDELILCYGDPE